MPGVIATSSTTYEPSAATRKSLRDTSRRPSVWCARTATSPQPLLDELGDVAVRAHQTLGLRDVSRSDFLVAPDGSYVVLEVAITPGTTETSVFPYACAASGTTLGQVALGLLERAIAR